jgi:hypothetical protein
MKSFARAASSSVGTGTGRATGSAGNTIDLVKGTKEPLG